MKKNIRQSRMKDKKQLIDVESNDLEKDDDASYDLKEASEEDKITKTSNKEKATTKAWGGSKNTIIANLSKYNY